jgi:hypothetical protein
VNDIKIDVREIELSGIGWIDLFRIGTGGGLF